MLSTDNILNVPGSQPGCLRTIKRLIGIADRDRIAHSAVHGSYDRITYGIGIWIRILSVWNVRCRFEATISNFQLSWVVVMVGRDPIDSGYDPSILETIRTVGRIGCFYRAKCY